VISETGRIFYGGSSGYVNSIDYLSSRFLFFKLGNRFVRKEGASG